MKLKTGNREKSMTPIAGSSLKRSVILISLWLTKKKRENAQIANTRTERGNITTDSIDTKEIINCE